MVYLVLRRRYGFRFAWNKMERINNEKDVDLISSLPARIMGSMDKKLGFMNL